MLTFDGILEFENYSYRWETPGKTYQYTFSVDDKSFHFVGTSLGWAERGDQFYFRYISIPRCNYNVSPPKHYKQHFITKLKHVKTEDIIPSQSCPPNKEKWE